MGDGVEEVLGLFGLVKGDVAAGEMDFEGVGLKGIEWEGCLDGLPMVESRLPIRCIEVIKGFSVAKLESRFVGSKAGCGPECLKHFGIELVG